VELVLARLDVLASFNPSADYAPAADEVRRVQASGGAVDFGLTEGFALLRALDHIRWEQSHVSKELHRLRDAMVWRVEDLLRLRGALVSRVEPIHYDLELVPPRALDVQDFVSYSGAYRVGDVLPVKDGHLLKVVEVRVRAGQRTVLACDVTELTPA